MNRKIEIVNNIYSNVAPTHHSLIWNNNRNNRSLLPPNPEEAQKPWRLT
jgi:hypothetical protein